MSDEIRIKNEAMKIVKETVFEEIRYILEMMAALYFENDVSSNDKERILSFIKNSYLGKTTYHDLDSIIAIKNKGVDCILNLEFFGGEAFKEINNQPKAQLHLLEPTRPKSLTSTRFVRTQQ